MELMKDLKAFHYYHYKLILFTKLQIIILLSTHYTEINKLVLAKFLLTSCVCGSFSIYPNFLLIILPSLLFLCFICNFVNLERFRTRVRNLCTKNKIIMKLGLSRVKLSLVGTKTDWAYFADTEHCAAQINSKTFS